MQQIHENNRLLQSLGGALWSVWHPLLHYYHIHFIIKICQCIFNIFTNLLCAVSYECIQRCDWFVIVELNVIHIGWVYSALIFSYSFSYVNDLRYNTCIKNLKELILCKKTTVLDALFEIIIVNSILRNTSKTLWLFKHNLYWVI